MLSAVSKTAGWKVGGLVPSVSPPVAGGRGGSAAINQAKFKHFQGLRGQRKGGICPQAQAVLSVAFKAWTGVLPRTEPGSPA